MTKDVHHNEGAGPDADCVEAAERVIASDAKAMRDPYTGPGLAGVPTLLERCADTPAKLSRVVREALFLRRTGLHEASRRAGVGEAAVARVVLEGHGSIGDVMALLGALGIFACTLPPLSELEKT